jgi:hypothetical protein
MVSKTSLKVLQRSGSATYKSFDFIRKLLITGSPSGAENPAPRR